MTAKIKKIESKKILHLIPKVLMLLKFSFLTVIIFPIVWVIFYTFISPPYSLYMLIKKWDNKQEIQVEKIPFKQISKWSKLAVIASEDGKFYSHMGFDFEAIKKAQEHNKKSKRKRGASTISQQTAKNLFLYPSRSFIRKGLETYFTILIEIFWTKDKILEHYLNSIELGPGIYGVQAAAKKYFQKNAKDLTLSEASLMASVLPNPIKFRINRPSSYVLKRQSKISQILRGIKNPSESNQMSLEPIQQMTSDPLEEINEEVKNDDDLNEKISTQSFNNNQELENNFQEINFQENN